MTSCVIVNKSLHYLVFAGLKLVSIRLGHPDNISFVIHSTT